MESDPNRATERPKMVLFHRDFRGFAGGHLKVWDYFNHVQAAPGFRAQIAFANDSVWNETNPCLPLRAEALANYDHSIADVLFVAGEDWCAMPEAFRLNPTVPIINLVQSTRHSNPDLSLYGYLAYPAIRITVAQAISDAILSTGQVNGPVLTNPCGLSFDQLPAPLPWNVRQVDVVVCAYKARDLGKAIAEQLEASGNRVELLTGFLPRDEYLSRVRKTKVAVMLPVEKEGVYLAAVEAMALETLVACPAFGNDGYSKHGVTAEVPERTVSSTVESAHRLLAMNDAERAQRLGNAKQAILMFSMEEERKAFQNILRDTPELWRDLRRSGAHPR